MTRLLIVIILIGVSSLFWLCFVRPVTRSLVKRAEDRKKKQKIFEALQERLRCNKRKISELDAYENSIVMPKTLVFRTEYEIKELLDRLWQNSYKCKDYVRHIEHILTLSPEVVIKSIEQLEALISSTEEIICRIKLINKDK